MWWALALLACTSTEPEPVWHTVAPGDTLFVIAKNNGVTVAQLTAWNELASDRIDVGQRLAIRPWEATGEPPLPTKRQAGSAGVPNRPAVGSQRRKAVPEPCLALPSLDDLGEGETVAATGISAAQARAVVNPLLPDTLPCVAGASGRVVVDLHIGCNGLVTEVSVVQSGPWDDAVHACIRDVLLSADFPAHALPDGDVVRWPLTYSP